MIAFERRHGVARLYRLRDGDWVLDLPTLRLYMVATIDPPRLTRVYLVDCTCAACARAGIVLPWDNPHFPHLRTNADGSATLRVHHGDPPVRLDVPWPSRAEGFS